jgi:hypothetical protein
VYEGRFSAWLQADRDWLRRAERGPGAAGGPDATRTSYFYNRRFQPYGQSWGPVSGGEGCGSPSPSPSCFIVPTPDPSTGVLPALIEPSPSGSEPAPEPCPPASEEPSAFPSDGGSPSLEPSPPPSEAPSPTPTPTPSPIPNSPPPDVSPSAQAFAGVPPFP